MVKCCNDICRVHMPNITPHVCRHPYYSNRAKAGMNPKTLQYLMGHSDIGVTLNTYTHPGPEDVAEELVRMTEVEAHGKSRKNHGSGTRCAEDVPGGMNQGYKVLRFNYGGASFFISGGNVRAGMV